MNIGTEQSKVLSLLRHNAIWLIVVAELLVLSLASGGTFVSWNNLLNILRQISYLGIASIGMTFVILTGGIDLSVGSIVTFVNMICAYIMVNMGMSLWIAVPAALLSAVLLGVFNGFMIANVKMPALIATFITQIIIEGLAYLLIDGRPISGFMQTNPGMNFFARWTVAGIPICAILMALCFVIGWFILNKTYFGRYVYAIGGNEEASRLSGISVNGMKYLVYTLSALFAGFAGIVLLSRSGSAQTTVGKGFEFDVITCVVLGGISVKGGVGRISGVLAGTLIIGALTNGMILLNISEYMQMVTKGLVLAIAVGVDCITAQKRAQIR